MLTPTLCKIGWFAKIQKPKKFDKKAKYHQNAPKIRGSYFSNISNTLLDQKSPAFLVPVVDGGDIHFFLHTDIADSRLNRPRGPVDDSVRISI